jgi:hypothetical protein
MTLNGLEELLHKTFRVARVKGQLGKYLWPKVNFVRYADDCAPRVRGREDEPGFVRNCTTDEGKRPLGTGGQARVSNRLRRLGSKARVVSTEGKGLERTGSDR